MKFPDLKSTFCPYYNLILKFIECFKTARSRDFAGGRELFIRGCILSLQSVVKQLKCQCSWASHKFTSFRLPKISHRLFAGEETAKGQKTVQCINLAAILFTFHVKNAPSIQVASKNENKFASFIC